MKSSLVALMALVIKLNSIRKWMKHSCKLILLFPKTLLSKMFRAYLHQFRVAFILINLNVVDDDICSVWSCRFVLYCSLLITLLSHICQMYICVLSL